MNYFPSFMPLLLFVFTISVCIDQVTGSSGIPYICFVGLEYCECPAYRYSGSYSFIYNCHLFTTTIMSHDLLLSWLYPLFCIIWLPAF